MGSWWREIALQLGADPTSPGVGRSWERVACELMNAAGQQNSALAAPGSSYPIKILQKVGSQQPIVCGSAERQMTPTMSPTTIDVSHPKALYTTQFLKGKKG